MASGVASVGTFVDDPYNKAPSTGTNPALPAVPKTQTPAPNGGNGMMSAQSTGGGGVGVAPNTAPGAMDPLAFANDPNQYGGGSYDYTPPNTQAPVTPPYDPLNPYKNVVIPPPKGPASGTTPPSNGTGGQAGYGTLGPPIPVDPGAPPGWSSYGLDEYGIYLRDNVYRDASGKNLGTVWDYPAGIDGTTKIPIDPATGKPREGGVPLVKQRPPGYKPVFTPDKPPDPYGGKGPPATTVTPPATSTVTPPPPVVTPPPTDTTGGLPPGWDNLPQMPDLGPDFGETDPDEDLRSMQITPGSLVDRFKLAQQQFGTFADSTSAQYGAALRDATRAAAGAGRLGSGMLRTSYGDLANMRTQALTNSRDTLFQNALLGSIQDAQSQFDNYLKEQNFQLGSQNQGFNQAVKAAELQEALTNGSFQRALAQLIQGNANDPSSMLMQMASLFSGQAGAGMQSLGQMMQNVARGNDNASQTELMALLKQMLEQMGAGGGGVNPIPESEIPVPLPQIPEVSTGGVYG